MILGFYGASGRSLATLIGAASASHSEPIIANRAADGIWTPHPDVVVVRDVALLDPELPTPIAPQGVPVIVVRDDPREVPVSLLNGTSPVTVSLGERSDFVGAELEFTRDGTRFDVHVDGQILAAQIHAVGDSQVIDALVAYAVATTLGSSLSDAIRRLADRQVSVRWSDGLMTREDGVTVFNETSEADPSTVAAALKTLTLMTYGSSRAVAVLGEMTVEESVSRDEHDRIGRLVVRLNVGKLIVVGYGARHIHNAAGLEGSWDGESVLVDSIDEAYDLLGKELRNGDVVLVKSSKAAGLGLLADRLGGKTA
ncbi:MAG: glutamate ligase domain-containing protein [Microbacteriaceae bacterium]